MIKGIVIVMLMACLAAIPASMGFSPKSGQHIHRDTGFSSSRGITALLAVIECKSPDSDFEQTLKANEWAIVDFYADWCGPCKIAAKTFHSVAEEFPNKSVKFIKVDTEVFEDTVDIYGLKGLPVFGVFKNGKLVQKHEGNMGKDSLLTFIQEGKKQQ